MALFQQNNSLFGKERQGLPDEKYSQDKLFSDLNIFIASLIWAVFVLLSILVLSYKPDELSSGLSAIFRLKNYPNLPAIAVTDALICIACAVYIYLFQNRLIKSPARTLALAVILILLLFISKTGLLLSNQDYWAIGTAVCLSIILCISFNQRFAVGISVFYCLLAAFLNSLQPDFKVFLIMAAGAMTCCFSLKEIRTRLKLPEVSALAAFIVFIMSAALSYLEPQTKGFASFFTWLINALVTFGVGIVINGMLPFIEKYFGIVTGMTLLDYSYADQPLLKKLAIEAPGTYSHCLLVGSIAEAAAESIGRNGLLCRVGAYYHDIGKITKSSYFIENEMGLQSKHKELSPTMSQHIIIGHVKDGLELAEEYGLPKILRQFVETHHGTTLVEYFYHEAKRKRADKQAAPSDSEFRYPGPKPQTKEAAIVMLADTIEATVRSLNEPTAGQIEGVVHTMAMRRLQDGQFDECDLTLRELHLIEESMSKTLAAHYHGRIPYPNQPDVQQETPVTEA